MFTRGWHHLQICDASSGDDISVLPLIVSGVAELSQRRVENAGRTFFQRYELQEESEESECEGSQGQGNSYGDSKAASGVPTKGTNQRGGRTRAEDKRRKARMLGAMSAARITLTSNKLKELTDPDHEKNNGTLRTLYEKLEVKPTSTSDEIRKSYRRLALLHHPDKQPKKQSCTDEQQSPTTEEDEQEFIEVQEAYEILTNEETRRQYESALPFDDSVPTSSQLGPCVSIPDSDIDTACDAVKQFYEVLHEAFTRNAKWSMNRPVPELGDSSTSMDDVLRFYEFWFSFESWRDFTLDHEHDLSTAECREERRWMERQNAKTSAKANQAEHRRIMKLAELSHQNDPRIRTHNYAIEQEKRDKKNALKKGRQAEREKEKAQKEAERQKVEDEQNAIKMANEAKEQKAAQTRQDLRARRIRIRCLTASFTQSGAVESYGLSGVCGEFEPAAPGTIDESLTRLQSIEADAMDVIESRLEGVSRDDVNSAIDAFVKEASFKTGVLPDFDECEIPASALPFEVDEPTQETIAACINRHIKAYSDAERARQEEMLRISAKLESDRKAGRGKEKEKKRTVASQAWSTQELSLLAKGLQKYPGGTARRWHMVAAIIQTKNAEEVIEKAKEMADGTSLRALGPELSRGAYEFYQRTQKGLHADVGSAPDQRDIGTLPEKKSEESFPRSVWTKEEQACLEKTLLKYPSTMAPKERWTAISSEVPGKTPKECLARFKEIRESILAARAKKE